MLMQPKTFDKHRLAWLLVVAAVFIAGVWISIARFTRGPLILVFDVDGKLLLRRRGVFANEDYPIRFERGKWYIKRPDEIAEEFIEDPLPRVTTIAAPYKTRVLDGWYYILEAKGKVRAVKEDGLTSTEVRYIDGEWKMNVEGEWMPWDMNGTE